MPVRLIPHTLIAFVCVMAIATGQEQTTHRGSNGRQDLERIPPVSLHVVDEAASSRDPAPVPPAVLESHTAVSSTQQPGPESMLLSSEIVTDATCQHGDGACRNCNHVSRTCPPSRWNVIGRIGYCWNTRTKPCLQASHWGYPEEFCERPFGSYTRADLCARSSMACRTS